jgi:quinoprotein glucose dehydrogenase
MALCTLLLVAAGPLAAQQQQAGTVRFNDRPQIAPASDEGQKAIVRIRVPAGFQVNLWAAEPLLANPVAFSIDEQGHIYVAETFRQLKGVEDNRDHADWVDEDLAAMTVADRLAFFRRHLGDQLEARYGTEQDRIRRLTDSNHDGQADDSVVFADGFHGVLEGTGAGVLARQGTVWYTNIPHLWSLRDSTGGGRADERTSLHSGYGVRVAFRGHDSHGLRLGPDGRIYFSIGDRGFNVQTREQNRLVYPDQGAVLRCNPDGSELEVVHAGLRNPQELAFDEFGNLFTGDNNSDSGDKARWVQVVEGADSGWRMNYQYLPDRGPWNREKLWHPRHEGQAAWILPPIANLADGPSGLAYAPGVGFPQEHQGRFYLCDFRGAFQGSGVRSIRLAAKGATFEVVDNQQFAWQILATDVDFAPDGSMYLTDWVEGWDGQGKGRIYRIIPDGLDQDTVAQATARLLAEGFANRSVPELQTLLSHPSQMIRQEAQFALAAKPLAEAGPALAARLRQPDETKGGTGRLARLHAVWGLGQAWRNHVRTSGPPPPAKKAEYFAPVLEGLQDADLEVRAQAAVVLGDCRQLAAIAPLTAKLADPEPRVRFHAALALAKLVPLAPAEAPAVGAALVRLVRENADQDVTLRHAAVMGLAGLSDGLLLQRLGEDPNASVRLAVVLALRKLRRADLDRFLSDNDAAVVDEAARAIYDIPLTDGFPALAQLASRSGLSEATVWRVLGANFHLGTAETAEALAYLAARADLAPALRIEASRALAAWARPSGRDRVLGSWRPLTERDPQVAATAVRRQLAGMLAGAEPVRQAATETAVKLGISEIGATLLKLVQDVDERPQSRADAVTSLALLKDERLAPALKLALEDRQGVVRGAGLQVLAEQDPAAALRRLPQSLERGDLVEAQMAAGLLGRLETPDSQTLLSQWVEKLAGGQVAPGLVLDLLEAARRRNHPALTAQLEARERASQADPQAALAPLLAGGNGDRGRRIFFEKAEVYCVRCHKVEGRGGEVGPDLTKVAAQQGRQYLLESILHPDQAIAKGYEPVVVLTTDGRQLSGTLREEDGTRLILMTAEGNLVTVPLSEIDERARGKSAMPEDLAKKLSKFELRDLVEYLAGLK